MEIETALIEQEFHTKPWWDDEQPQNMVFVDHAMNQALYRDGKLYTTNLTPVPFNGFMRLAHPFKDDGLGQWAPILYENEWLQPVEQVQREWTRAVDLWLPFKYVVFKLAGLPKYQPLPLSDTISVILDNGMVRYGLTTNLIGRTLPLSYRLSVSKELTYAITNSEIGDERINLYEWEVLRALERWYGERNSNDL